MKKAKFNDQVTVVAFGFRKNLTAYPKSIEFDGEIHSFIDAGLRCLVKHGGKIAEVLTLSDGKKNYYLRTYNKGSNWTLLKTSC